MKIEISKDEQTMLLEGLAKHKASADRAAKATKNPELQACHLKQVTLCGQLENKLITMDIK